MTEYALSVKSFLASGLIEAYRRVRISKVRSGYIEYAASDEPGVGTTEYSARDSEPIAVIPYLEGRLIYLEITGDSDAAYGSEIYSAPSGKIQGYPITTGTGEYYKMGTIFEDSIGVGGIVLVQIAPEFRIRVAS